MSRRRFVRSVLLAGAGAAMPGRLLRAAPGGKLILPTDTPDRHHLKVMAFNPIPPPDPRTWELAIGGLVAETLRLKVSDLASLNTLSSIGAATIALSMLALLANLFLSSRRRVPARVWIARCRLSTRSRRC